MMLQISAVGEDDMIISQSSCCTLQPNPAHLLFRRKAIADPYRSISSASAYLVASSTSLDILATGLNKIRGLTKTSSSVNEPLNGVWDQRKFD
jgi:hypothetical protein